MVILVSSIKEGHPASTPGPPPFDPGSIGLNGDTSPSELLSDNLDNLLVEECIKYENESSVSAPGTSSHPTNPVLGVCMRVGRKCAKHKCGMQ